VYSQCHPEMRPYYAALLWASVRLVRPWERCDCGVLQYPSEGATVCLGSESAAKKGQTTYKTHSLSVYPCQVLKDGGPVDNKP
jgi:hypothetical protein